MKHITNILQGLTDIELPPDAAFGPPVGTDRYTSDQLSKMGLVGLYLKEDAPPEVLAPFWLKADKKKLSQDSPTYESVRSKVNQLTAK